MIAGEDCVTTTRGMFLITTNGVAPFATGRWTDEPIGLTKNGLDDITKPVKKTGDPLLQQLDQWGKLEGGFNNRISFNALADWDQLSTSADEEDNYRNAAVEQPNRTQPINRRKVIMPAATISPKQNHIRFLQRYKQNLTMGIMSDDSFTQPEVLLKD